MKVTLIEKQAKEKPEFPILRTEKIGKFTVLFSSKNVGVVVHVSPNSNYQVGHYSSGWTNANSEECWKDFTGSITLEN